eukprot:TRINITY_DN27792_c0_g1_i1.p1 TRINITY_DN27792_c0_g1~~TRINITY_DN27792_c0_g1_i1.p1  ORF type:complete len:250 (+),score=58.94 TRINITY_DN27792_c0_g1_i1:102-752(+)
MAQGAARRSGLLYSIAGRCNTVYVALTNHSDSVGLVASRGPGFSPPVGPVDGEPEAEEVVAACLEALPAEGRRSVVYAGWGEPTLRLGVLLQSAAALRRAGVSRVRVVTNGLAGLRGCPGVPERLSAAGVGAVTVAVNGHTPQVFADVMQPQHGAPLQALESALDFLRQCASLGMETEAAVVAHPAVDVERAGELAAAAGARLRERPYFPARDGRL